MNGGTAVDVRSILHHPCAVICAKEELSGVEAVTGRELWVFSVTDAARETGIPGEGPVCPDGLEGMYTWLIH